MLDVFLSDILGNLVHPRLMWGSMPPRDHAPGQRTTTVVVRNGQYLSKYENSWLNAAPAPVYRLKRTSDQITANEGFRGKCRRELRSWSDISYTAYHFTLAPHLTTPKSHRPPNNDLPFDVFDGVLWLLRVHAG